MQGVRAILPGACAIALALGGCDRDSKADDAAKAKDAPSKTAKADDAPAKADDPPSKEAPAKADAAKPSEDERDGCEELTEAMVREAVGLDASVKVTQRARKGGHGGCYYEWDNPDYDMAKAMQAGAAALDKKGPDLMDPKLLVGYERGETFGDADAAQKAFEQSQAHLPEQDKDAEGKPAYVSVEGIGDAAVWESNNPHIAVRDGTRLFFVSIKIGKTADDERPVAEKLAKAIIGGE